MKLTRIAPVAVFAAGLATVAVVVGSDSKPASATDAFLTGTRDCANVYIDVTNHTGSGMSFKLVVADGNLTTTKPDDGTKFHLANGAEQTYTFPKTLNVTVSFGIVSATLDNGGTPKFPNGTGGQIQPKAGCTPSTVPPTVPPTPPTTPPALSTVPPTVPPTTPGTTAPPAPTTTVKPPASSAPPNPPKTTPATTPTTEALQISLPETR